MIGKTIVLVICKHKQVKSIVFAVSMKFCDESGLAIFFHRFFKTQSLKKCSFLSLLSTCFWYGKRPVGLFLLLPV